MAELQSSKGLRSAAQNAAGGQSSVVCALSKFANNAKLHRIDGTPDGCAATQRDLGRLGNRAKRDLKKFSKGKCKVLHLRRNNAMHQYMLGANWPWQRTLAEKDLGIPIDTNLNMSQQLLQRWPTAS